MDWMESIFGIAPDGGSGLTEVALFVAFATALLVVRRMRRFSRARR